MIKIAILDDHLSIVDGYSFRLEKNPLLEIAATASFGEELIPMVDNNDIDILILDIDVPISPMNDQRFPIPPIIPKILEKHPDIQILVITMLDRPSLAKTLLENGASGFILKDDEESISQLDKIILSIFNGEIYISDDMQNELSINSSEKKIKLTDRQYEILSLCANEPSIKTIEIADELNIAHSTVRNNLSKIYIKLGVRNRHGAVVVAREKGLLPK